MCIPRNGRRSRWGQGRGFGTPIGVDEDGRTGTVRRGPGGTSKTGVRLLGDGQRRMMLAGPGGGAGQRAVTQRMDGAVGRLGGWW